MPEHSQFLLSQRPPSRSQRVAVIVTASLLIVGVVVVAPFAEVPLEGAAPFLPAYAAAVLCLDVIAGALIVGQFLASRQMALLALLAAYVFDGIAVAAWALSFPGAFSEAGILSGGIQTTAVIAAGRRLAFPAGVLAYGVLRLREAQVTSWQPGHAVAATTLAAMIAALGLTWVAVAGEDFAPGFMADARAATPVWSYVLWSSIALVMCAALVLLRRRTKLCVLDLWLLMTLAALLIEILMLGFLASGLRFSVGWWGGRAFGLIAVAIVAIALLTETASLNVQLATALLAEKQARRARTATLEALGAAIAHELNQPLGAIVTGANAATRWLDHPGGGIDHVRVRLAGIASDGRRAGVILSGLRRTFGRHPAQYRAIGIADLIRSTAALARTDAQAARVRLSIEIGCSDCTINADPEQLRQAILNLLTNAFAAMADVPPANRVAIIGCRREGERGIIAIQDTGIGLDESRIGRIFEPFWTTKAGGMGLGLLISSTIVEAHGGRLTARNSGEGGALFEIDLPLVAGAQRDE